jgi:hypothetical protein
MLFVLAVLIFSGCSGCEGEDQNNGSGDTEISDADAADIDDAPDSSDVADETEETTPFVCNPVSKPCFDEPQQFESHTLCPRQLPELGTSCDESRISGLCYYCKDVEGENEYIPGNTTILECTGPDAQWEDINDPCFD